MRKTRKMKAQPRAMSKICHHSNALFAATGTGAAIPVMVGSAEGVTVPEGVGTTTS
jgi:hypothetical protein